MSDIAITADIHFGVPGRLNDILYACKTIREYCKTANIDTILILGDLFHDRRYLEIDVLSAAYRFFKESKEDYGQRWIAFPGNHDMFLRHSWAINSLTPFNDVMTIIEDVCKLEIERQTFWVLPFITFEKSYMTVLNKINEMADEHDMLLTHIGVNGATMNTCFTLKDWGLVNFCDTKFKRVYTGHFHSRQSLYDRVFYPGSPIPFKFDEGDVPHGFYHLDLNSKEHKFINIWKAGSKFFPKDTPPPQYCNILDTQIDDITTLDIKNNKIRVAISSDISQEKKADLKQKLFDMGAESVGWMELKQNQAPQGDQIIDFKKDLFQQFLESNPKLLKDYDIDLLNRLNMETLREGDEQYSLSQNIDS